MKFLSRDVQSNDQFLKLNEMINPFQMLIKTKKTYFVLNDIFVKLTLILPMRTVPIERSIFLQWIFVKNKMCNHKGDEWLNNSLIAYIREIFFCSINNKKKSYNIFKIWKYIKEKYNL